MIAHALSRLRWLVTPPDPREPIEIESDLTDEFEFHLRMLQREEEAAGASPETARVAAERRFGDVQRVRRACRAIALAERTMMQRLNAILTIVLLLAVIGIGTQVVLGLRKTTLALDTIGARVEALGDRPNGAIAAVDARTDSDGGTPTDRTTESARGRSTVDEWTESNFDRTRFAWLSGDVMPRAVDVLETPNGDVLHHAHRRIDRLALMLVPRALPQIYQPAAQIRATIRRPRGDGSDEVIEAGWTGWFHDHDPQFREQAELDRRADLPRIAAADRIESRFTMPSPLPELPEGWAITARVDELHGALAVLGAAIRESTDGRADGSVDVDPETLDRYRVEKESVRLRLAAMGIFAAGNRSE